SRCFETVRPSTSTRSPSPTNVLRAPGTPLTLTRPSLISWSAPRREATPARARYALRRISAFSPPGPVPSRAMRDFSDEIARLADLAVGFGANVQEGQLVAVTSYTGKEELTRAVAHAAYEHGARYVDVLYFDPWVKRERIAHAPEDSIGDVPPWLMQRLEWLS